MAVAVMVAAPTLAPVVTTPSITLATVTLSLDQATLWLLYSSSTVANSVNESFKPSKYSE